MISWGAEHLRLTTFGTAPTEQAWKHVTGAEPETSLVNQRLATREEHGDFKQCRLSYSRAVGREDWRVGPASPSADQTTPAQTIEIDQAQQALGVVFSQLVANPSWRPTRIAFGAVLLAPQNSRETGYANLSKLMPALSPLDPKSEDFSYQINRPRTSITFDAVKLNRVSKWSVQSLTVFSLMTGGTVSLAAGDPIYQCRLELDVNTDGNRTESLPAHKLQGIWDELVKLGLEISQNGDIP